MRLNKDLIMQPNTVVHARTEEEHRLIRCLFNENGITNWIGGKWEEDDIDTRIDHYNGYEGGLTGGIGNYTVLTLDDAIIKEKEIRKEDLKSGIHSVVFKNGITATFNGDYFVTEDEDHTHLALENYGDNLKRHPESQWDVVAVLESNLLWQREEKEMIDIDGVKYDKKDILKALEYKEIMDMTTPKEEPKDE